MKILTIINDILILKSICLVSNAFGNHLLNIYISGFYLQVHDVTLQSKEIHTQGYLDQKDGREERGKNLTAKG